MQSLRGQASCMAVLRRTQRHKLVLKSPGWKWRSKWGEPCPRPNQYRFLSYKHNSFLVIGDITFRHHAFIGSRHVKVVWPMYTYTCMWLPHFTDHFCSLTIEVSVSMVEAQEAHAKEMWKIPMSAAWVELISADSADSRHARLLPQAGVKRCVPRSDRTQAVYQQAVQRRLFRVWSHDYVPH